MIEKIRAAARKRLTNPTTSTNPTASTNPSELAEKGFTLIELMVVIIIIGILAAIAIPAFLNQRVAAWDSSVKSDLANYAIAASSYATAHNGSYSSMTTAALGTTYGFTGTSGNTLGTLAITNSGGSTGTGYTITDYNSNSGATGHTFTLTTGTISGP